MVGRQGKNIDCGRFCPLHSRECVILLFIKIELNNNNILCIILNQLNHV